MIHLGAKDPKIAGGGGGVGGGEWGVGGGGAPLMIEQVRIQAGAHFNRKGGGGGQEELATLRMQEAKAKNRLGKQRMQKAKARKPPKATKPKSHLPERNW